MTNINKKDGEFVVQELAISKRASPSPTCELQSPPAEENEAHQMRAKLPMMGMGAVVGTDEHLTQ